MENITLELPFSKSKVVLRPYPTARMEAAQSAIFLRHSTINLDNVRKGKKADPNAETKPDDVVDIKDLPAEAINEINEVTVKNFVISIDDNEFGGDRDAILETCLDMHKRDFKAILDRCNEINKQAELSDEKKAS